MTKLIPILSGLCLVVELPDRAKQPKITQPFGIYLTFVDGFGFNRVKLPPGNWRIIGMLSEVTEDQVFDLVDWHHVSDNMDLTATYAFKDYVNGEDDAEDYWDEYMLDTAIEALESSILAEGYYLNEDELEAPNRLEFGYYEDFDAEGHLNGAGWGTEDGEQKYHEAIDKFISAQSRVLDRSRCLLLGRVDG